MLRIYSNQALKIILLCALINSSIFNLTSHMNLGLRFIIAFLMNLSGILLIIFFIKLIRKGFDSNIYFKFVYTLIILWSLFVIFHSFSFDLRKIITLFGHYLMGWAWLTPLAIVFGFRIEYWLSLFKFVAKILLIGSILSLIVFFEPKYVFGLLEWMYFLPILLLTSFYQPKKIKKIIVISLITFILLTYFASQRANILFLVVLFIFLLVEYYRQSFTKTYKKIIISLFAFFLIFIFSLEFNTILTQIKQNKELTIDTRTFLIKEMFSDMSESEQIIGRGALGKYYSAYFAETKRLGLGGDSPLRSVNEIGYLEMILKGGYILMILYLIFLLPAAYLGIFKSKNIISRMSGYYILSYLILWLFSYYPVYSPRFILLWMAAGTAISKRIRNIKNEEILTKINERIEFAK